MKEGGVGGGDLAKESGTTKKKNLGVTTDRKNEGFQKTKGEKKIRQVKKKPSQNSLAEIGGERVEGATRTRRNQRPRQGSKRKRRAGRMTIRKASSNWGRPAM